jgi:hypothetical protein
MSTTWSLYDRTYNLASLDDIEMAYFEAAFNTLMGTHDSVEREILQDRKDVVLAAVQAVKAAVFPANPAFRGFEPGDMELGMAEIRPAHVTYAATGGQGHPNVWDLTIPAATWTDWLCNATTAATGYTLDKRMGQVILYLKCFDSPVPLVSEVQFKIGRTQLMPSSVRNIQMLDNVNNVPVYPLPTMLVLPSVDQLYGQMYSDYGGVTRTAIGGLTIGLGAFLKNTATLTWQT